LNRVLPFLLVAVAAEVSVALPPGPTSAAWTAVSAVLLAVTIASFCLPWSSLPSWADVIPAVLYLGSTLALFLAIGDSTPGVGSIALLAIVWTALYQERWKSLVVLTVSAIAQFITTIAPVDVSDTVRFRRVVFWIVISSLVSYSTHQLRSRISQSNRARQQANEDMARSIKRLELRDRDNALLSGLADMLHSCVDRQEAYDVIGTCGKPMFPEGGALMIFDAGREVLEVAAAWGDLNVAHATFPPTKCWALQRGLAYESKNDALMCAHLEPSRWERVVCRPLIALGDTVGVFSFIVPPSATDEEADPTGDDRVRHLASAVGEQIAISISNFQLSETLRSFSVRDPLTNLYNRRFMEDALCRELSVHSEEKQDLAVLHIEVDHFRTYTDTYGHEVGDAILRLLGNLLSTLFHGTSMPCRYGGEEFAVVMPGCSLKKARSRAIDLQAAVSGLRIPLEGNRISPTPPTLSIGIATSPDDGSTKDDVIRAASRALYAAKAAGRNRVMQASANEPRLDASR
jgi:diguanylate cyclase (GGDEF)-like protein